MGLCLSARLSTTQLRTCAALVGDDARLPGELAVRERVTVSAIYKRRRRAEQRLGCLLPRLHRIGRPISN
jgi:hypothetical protein